MPGPELLARMRTHATRYGARVEAGRVMRFAPAERGLIRHCPICDGYEVIGQKIGVIGFGAGAVNEALFIRNRSADVTLLTLGHRLELDDRQSRSLAQAGIKVVADPVTRMDMEEGHIAAVETAGGGRLGFDTLYSALGACVRSDLAVAATMLHRRLMGVGRLSGSKLAVIPNDQREEGSPLGTPCPNWTPTCQDEIPRIRSG